MRRLVQRTQPTSDSCMSAAIAMIADMDVNEVYNQLHSDLISKELWFDEVMDGLCIDYRYMFPKHNTMHMGKVYIASVPSLNMEGTHSIVIDVRKNFKILDPNCGRPNKLVYGDDAMLQDFTLMLEFDGSLFEET